MICIDLDKSVIESDKFLDMPKTTQLLFFFYLLDLDENGCIVHPQSILQTNGFGSDDYKLLMNKGFIGTNGIDVYINV